MICLNQDQGHTKLPRPFSLFHIRLQSVNIKKKQPINRNRNKQSYKHPGEQQGQGLKIWLRENTQIHSVFLSNIYKFYSRLVCKKRAMGLI